MPLIKRARNYLPTTGQTDGTQGVGVDGDYQAGFVVGTRFVDNGDGTITDHATGLMWVKDGENDLPSPWSGTKNWSDGLSACEGLTWPVGEFTDWRMPNILELLSIYDWSFSTSPAAYSPFVVDSDYYWSSTTRKDGGTFAYQFRFLNSTALLPTPKTEVNFILPVRGGRFLER